MSVLGRRERESGGGGGGGGLERERERERGVCVCKMAYRFANPFTHHSLFLNSILLLSLFDFSNTLLFVSICQ